MSSTAADDQFAPRTYAYGRMWVAYVDFDLSTMSWIIGKVERWSTRVPVWQANVLRIDDAKDELDAYTQALKMLETAE